MAQSTANVTDFLEEHTVVDTDVHLSNPFSAELRKRIANRMSEPYQSYLDPDTGGSAYPSSGWSKTLGGKKNVMVDDVYEASHIREQLCDGLGVDYPIVNSFALVDEVQRTPRAIEETQATNDYLLEEILDEEDDFFGLISVPARNPEAAVEEIERLGDEDQIIGVFLLAGSSFQKPLGDPTFDAMYQAMEDKELTPVFHTGILRRKAPVLDELESYFSVHSVAPQWAGSLTLTSLIAQGVPEKFPDLNFVLMEYGISWVPFYIARLNREYGQWRSEVSILEQSPEEYIRDQFYFTTQPLGEFNNHRHMKSIIDIIGPESILFSTDYPHHDFDDPAGLALLRALSSEDRERVLGKNAIESFDLPI
ncbi:amidohydrolase family protein [Natronorubrum sp. FCH18a]|uniref:amidohydrolase family protein n=1 Tax=Natronorubrum sp. FCH18a TaxID=3447018 RepID=UPI003F5197CF